MVDRSSLRRAALAIALCAASFGAFAADYVQTTGSSLQFAGTYQGDAFSGSFPGFKTTFSFDPAQLASGKLDVRFRSRARPSATRRWIRKCAAPRSSTARRFPQARYTATKFRALGGNRYAADGTLSLRGVTKPVTLAFTWTPGAKPVLQGNATVKRLDFGVGGGEWADTSLLPNDIKVTTKVVFAPK